MKACNLPVVEVWEPSNFKETRNDTLQVDLTISRARTQLGIAYQVNCFSILASIPIDSKPVKAFDEFSGY